MGCGSGLFHRGGLPTLAAWTLGSSGLRCAGSAIAQIPTGVGKEAQCGARGNLVPRGAETIPDRGDRLPRNSLSWQPLKHTNELCRGKPKSGTTKFHAYATICIVEKGQRYTLAYTWVKRGEKQAVIIARLVERVREIGLRIQCLLLDRAFFNVATMKYLQAVRMPFVMPVVMRGRKPKPGRAAKGLRAFRKKRAGWYRHTMKSKGAEVSFSVCVAYKTYHHHRTKKRCQKKLIYAVWGVGGAPRELRERYRKRFGIETSYRQRREARIRTCTRDPKMRLFYVGISLFLRTIWVFFHAIFFADGTDTHPEPRLEKLRFADMLEWWADFIKSVLEVAPGFRIDCNTGKRFTADGDTSGPTH